AGRHASRVAAAAGFAHVAPRHAESVEVAAAELHVDLFAVLAAPAVPPYPDFPSGIRGAIRAFPTAVPPGRHRRRRRAPARPGGRSLLRNRALAAAILDLPGVVQCVPRHAAREVARIPAFPAARPLSFGFAASGGR